MNTYITVDIGGTKIRAAVYSTDGIEPIQQKHITTKGENSPHERLISLITKLWPENNKVLAIGVAVPGPINPKTGIIVSAPNIPGWVNFPIRNILEAHFNVPIFVGNDANMAVLGEWSFGAGKGYHNVLYMTISTGIGGGAILDDRLLLGKDGLASELGHITILPNGPICGCGQRGHLEALASGTAIARYVVEQLTKGRSSSLGTTPIPTAKDVGVAAKNGDPLALEALTRAGNYIGQALADYLHIYNPSIVIIGGGVSHTGPLIIEPIRTSLTRHVMSPEYINDLVISRALLGDDAGLLGTLALARMHYEENY